jgi:hypothetical protein
VADVGRLTFEDLEDSEYSQSHQATSIRIFSERNRYFTSDLVYI